MNFNNHESITGHLKVYADTWHSLPGLPITQTEFFKANIPDTKTDFTDTFKSKGLCSLFTSPKFTTKMLGSYNCNMLYRSVKEMPDVVIFSTDKFVVLHPLGEPGRDLGENHPFKIGHLMVVPRMVSNEYVTLNEMLPTTPQETEEIQEKNASIGHGLHCSQGKISRLRCVEIYLPKKLQNLVMVIWVCAI